MTPFRARPERGSALMLVPAAVLVLIMLAAITVDSAIVFLAQRDVANRAAAAANDIAGVALADEALYGGDDLVLDGEAAQAYVARIIGQAPLPARYLRMEATVAIDGSQVEVSAVAEVRRLFAPALAGLRTTATVEAVSTATATKLLPPP